MPQGAPTQPKATKKCMECGNIREPGQKKYCIACATAKWPSQYAPKNRRLDTGIPRTWIVGPHTRYFAPIPPPRKTDDNTEGTK